MGDNQQQDRGLLSGLYDKIHGVKTESTHWDGSYGNPHQNYPQPNGSHVQSQQQGAYIQPQGNHFQSQAQPTHNQGQLNVNYSAPPPLAYANSTPYTAYNPSAGIAASTSSQFNSTSTAIQGGRAVLFGAIVALKHNNSGRYLSSQGINYQTGSGQQQVTANQWNVTNLEKWQIVSGFNQPPVSHGISVNFNQTVRFKHLATGRFLHSHPNINSPVSQYQEVSAFGNDNGSDDNDNWVIEKFTYDGANQSGVLQVASAFKLKHCKTGLYLYSHEKTMQVNGITHAEVACYGNGRHENNKWILQIC